MICQFLATSYLPLTSASANDWYPATDKSRYFVQTRPIIDNYLYVKMSLINDHELQYMHNNKANEKLIRSYMKYKIGGYL